MAPFDDPFSEKNENSSVLEMKAQASSVASFTPAAAVDAYSWLAETASAYNPFSPQELPRKKVVVATRERSRSRSAPRPVRSQPVVVAQRINSGGSGVKSRRRRSLNRPMLTFEVLGEEELSAMRADLEARGLLVEVCG